MVLFCTLTSDGSENLGGGGGGIVLGRGTGIPLDDGWTNFLGAGIVDIFLTRPSHFSLGFRGCKPCNQDREWKKTKNQTQPLNQVLY